MSKANSIKPCFKNPEFSSWDKLLALGLGSTLLVWGGMTFWVLIFFFMGLRKAQAPTLTLDGANRLDLVNAIKWLAAGALIYMTTRLGMSIYHGNKVNLEPYLPFLLFPVMGLGVYKLRIQPMAFWVGAGLACIGALSISLYQRLGLGIDRAFGHINPISFGDISVIFAMICIIGATQRTPIHKTLRVALGFAALCAMYASLLSGSKGGWLSLMMVLLIGAHRTYQLLETKKTGFVVAALTLGFAALALLPHSVTERLSTGAKGGVTWLKTGQVTEMSVSIRLELWAFGIRLFTESPVTGVSHATMLESKKSWVSQGLYDPFLMELSTIDSQFIGDLAEGGLLGLAGTLASLVLPIIGFRRLMRSKNKVIHDLALVGTWIPVLFAEFGLSTSLWGQSAFRQVYVSWMVLLLALIAVQMRRDVEHKGQ